MWVKIGLFILSLFGMALPELLTRIAIYLGFGVVTTTGMFYLFDQVKSLFQAQLTGLPADVLAMVGIMKLDMAFTLILSAAMTKTVINGWNKLTDTRSGRVWQKPGTGGTIGM